MSKTKQKPVATKRSGHAKETSRVVPNKPYWEMTTEELAAATAEFDKEFAEDRFGEPPPEELARLRRADQKPGRPKNGRGVKVISLSVEKGLLSRADRLAKKLKISRAKLVSRGLEILLAQKATR